jgi:hypothetical protein
MIKVDINIGDIVLGGKFKNRKIEVKEIGKDEWGHPTINGKSLLKVRIEKLMKKETPMEKLEKVLKEASVTVGAAYSFKKKKIKGKTFINIWSTDAGYFDGFVKKLKKYGDKDFNIEKSGDDLNIWMNLEKFPKEKDWDTWRYRFDNWEDAINN